MFGLIEACVDFDQAVPTTVYRPTITDQKSGWQGRTWPATSTNKPRIAVAELKDKEVFRVAGKEVDADFRGVTDVAADIQEGDGLQIDATALHHAGRKFHVLAVRDPEGQYTRLFLQEDPKAKFGT